MIRFLIRVFRLENKRSFRGKLVEYRKLGRVARGIIGRLRRPIWYAFHFPHASPDGANLALTGELLVRLVMGL